MKNDHPIILDDGPPEEDDGDFDISRRQHFQAMAQLLDSSLNDHVDSDAEQVGFVLLCFPMLPPEDQSARFDFIANVANRAYVLEVMRIAVEGITKAVAKDSRSGN